MASRKQAISEEGSGGLLAFLQTKSTSKFQEFSDSMKNLLKMYLLEKNPIIPKHQLEAVFAVESRLRSNQEKNWNNVNNSATEPVIIIAPTDFEITEIIVMLPYVLASRKVLIVTASLSSCDSILAAFGGIRNEKSFFEKVGLVQETKEGREHLYKLCEPASVIRGPDDIVIGKNSNVVIVNAQKFYVNYRFAPELKRKISSDTDSHFFEFTKSFFEDFDTLIMDQYRPAAWNTIVKLFCSNNKQNRKLVMITSVLDSILSVKTPEGKRLIDCIAYQTMQTDLAGITTRKCKFVQPCHKYSMNRLLKDLEAQFQECIANEDRYKPKAMVLVRTTKEAKDLAVYLNKKTSQMYAIAAIATNRGSLRKFKNEEYSVAITSGMGLERYYISDVVICVILRNIKSKILFQNFIGKCAQMKTGLDGGPDRNTGIILSYPEFDQQVNWDKTNYVSGTDSVDSLTSDEDGI